jgi:hypothetical protein
MIHQCAKSAWFQTGCTNFFYKEISALPAFRGLIISSTQLMTDVRYVEILSLGVQDAKSVKMELNVRSALLTEMEYSSPK